VNRLRRILEEEYILVVLLAGFGLIFLLIFLPRSSSTTAGST
jgi:hypothetical protein